MTVKELLVNTLFEFTESFQEDSRIKTLSREIQLALPILKSENTHKLLIDGYCERISRLWRIWFHLIINQYDRIYTHLFTINSSLLPIVENLEFDLDKALIACEEISDSVALIKAINHVSRRNRKGVYVEEVVFNTILKGKKELIDRFKHYFISL